MRKVFVIICLLFLILVQNSFSDSVIAAEEKENKNIIELVTDDAYIMRANLKYPQKKKKKYPLVVLLHSYGLSSADWRELPNTLTNNGFAVLEIDFKGHGKSIYLTNMQQRSYIYLSKNSLKQFPQDVYKLLSQTYSTYSNLSATEIIFVGADVGASTAIYVAEALQHKPIAMVLISPQVNFKGLYTPIALAESGDYPILGIVTQKDIASQNEMKSLQKYIQGSFSLLKLPDGGPGMTSLAVNDKGIQAVTNWLVKQTPSLNSEDIAKN